MLRTSAPLQATLDTVSALLLFVSNPAPAADPPGLTGLDGLYPSLDALHLDLHRNPELSLHENRTAAEMAARLRAAGFEVTEHVGGTGVVGVLRNGPGPTVLVRTDMDALPTPEKTGLPYASAVSAKNDAGETVPVMHACGHDVDITFYGRGDHGAAPQRTIDPVLIAARDVASLQSIVSREVDPSDANVVTHEPTSSLLRPRRAGSSPGLKTPGSRPTASRRSAPASRPSRSPHSSSSDAPSVRSRRSMGS